MKGTVSVSATHAPPAPRTEHFHCAHTSSTTSSNRSGARAPGHDPKPINENRKTSETANLKSNPKLVPIENKSKNQKNRESGAATASVPASDGGGLSRGSRALLHTSTHTSAKCNHNESTVDVSREPQSSLFRARYKTQTQEQYLKALGAFERWAERCHPDVQPSTYAELDLLLSHFIEYLHVRGRGKGMATHAFYGLIMVFRGARGHLPYSSSMLAGWRVEQPSMQHPPLTWPLTCAIAHNLACDGHYKAAVATLLAFDCFLRIGELTSIQASHITDSKDVDRRIKSQLSIYLPQAKTGVNQSVQIIDPAVRALVTDVLRTALENGGTGASAGSDSGAGAAAAASAHSLKLSKRVREMANKEAPLFGVNAALYRKLFKRACKQLGLSESFVPHSLRHGGATTLYMLKVPVMDIKVRGRWKAVSTVERYLQAGEAVMFTVRAPKATLELGHRVATDPLTHFRALASPRVTGKQRPSKQ